MTHISQAFKKSEWMERFHHWLIVGRSIEKLRAKAKFQGQRAFVIIIIIPIFFFSEFICHRVRWHTLCSGFCTAHYSTLQSISWRKFSHFLCQRREENFSPQMWWWYQQCKSHRTSFLVRKVYFHGDNRWRWALAWLAQLQRVSAFSILKLN